MTQDDQVCEVPLTEQLRSDETVRMEKLAGQLIKQLASIPASRVVGLAAKRIPGIVSLAFRGVEGERLAAELDRFGIAVSTGSACSELAMEQSHVLKAIVWPTNWGVIRVSLGYPTKLGELRQLVKQLKF